MRGRKWPSFDRLQQAAPVSVEPTPAEYDNPFQAMEKEGPGLAEAGRSIAEMESAAIALGGLPKARDGKGGSNLHYYAEEIHRLHGTQAEGEA
jgi:hypothetical protein